MEVKVPQADRDLDTTTSQELPHSHHGSCNNPPPRQSQSFMEENKQVCHLSWLRHQTDNLSSRSNVLRSLFTGLQAGHPLPSKTYTRLHLQQAARPLQDTQHLLFRVLQSLQWTRVGGDSLFLLCLSTHLVHSLS